MSLKFAAIRAWREQPVCRCALGLRLQRLVVLGGMVGALVLALPPPALASRPAPVGVVGTQAQGQAQDDKHPAQAQSASAQHERRMQFMQKRQLMEKQLGIVTPPPTRDQMLRGANGPYRANNDLLYYHLNIRVDPQAKTVSGVNTIRFRMLKDDNRIQIDLQQPLVVNKIVFGNATLKYDRQERAVFIDFPKMLHKGQTYSIDFYYAGNPVHHGRFGNFTFGQGPAGKPWIYTADEGAGASTWWPSKEEWRDKPQDGMEISVAAPNGLTDVSNGKFAGKVDLHDGYTQWNWKVHYPINSYDVSVNIANYVHFSDKWGNYYVLPQDLAKAKKQFKQVGGMIEAYQHYFGQYPFVNDGYKLVQAPYSGMEHQSAVTYGNGFKNGYLGKDWGGTPYALKFDFIIIHESGHEWFANGVTASDPADMWIHEGFTTYLESLYVEYHWGKAAAIEYVNGYQSKVQNLRPIIAEYGIGAEPPEDQYFKGALMLNTLRSVVNNDQRWWSVLHGLFQHFKYQSISTDDVIGYFNRHTGMNLTPIFDQYLRHSHIPTLDLLFGESPGLVMYKWNANVDAFAMPVRVGEPGHWQIIHPTTRWQWMKTPLTKDQFKVATDLYYVNVDKQ